MEYKFDVEDMSIELKGVARILTDILCEVEGENLSDYCDELTAVRGLISRISDDLQAIYDNEVWGKPADEAVDSISPSGTRMKNAIRLYDGLLSKRIEDSFTPYDVTGVIEAADSDSPIDLAYAALKAGFVIGYMKVKRQELKERRERKREEYV